MYLERVHNLDKFEAVSHKIVENLSADNSFEIPSDEDIPDKEAGKSVGFTHRKNVDKMKDALSNKVNDMYRE